MQYGVYVVFAPRPPAQINQTIVVWDAVYMQAFMPRGGFTNKCQQNQFMNTLTISTSKRNAHVARRHTTWPKKFTM